MWAAVAATGACPQSGPCGAREGTKYPVLGRLQLGRRCSTRSAPSTAPRSRPKSLTNDPTMINRLRAGETNVWDLINVNNPWARKIMYPGRADQAARPGDDSSPIFDKMLPAVQAALPLGDERGRQGSARHGPALRPVQLRRQHRQGQPRHRRGPGLGSVQRSGQCRASTAFWNPTTGTSSTSA